MEWIFDGIGTAIVTFVLGLFIGGGSGYSLAKHKTIQKSRDNSSQFQANTINFYHGISEQRGKEIFDNVSIPENLANNIKETLANSNNQGGSLNG